MTSRHQPFYHATSGGPVLLSNANGVSSFLLIGDHAGRAIPGDLGDLGIASSELDRHIAYDIGVRGMGERLAERLDAPFLHQAYSRLVIDCNRDPAAPDAMPERSDGTLIPANVDLDAAAQAAREAAIHAPYHGAIAAALDRRHAAGQPTILVSLHSFTPVMNGVARPWQVGVLHDAGATAFAAALLAELRGRGDLTVGDNEPYRMDLVDYTVPRHAFPRRLPYAEIEVRQDLISDAEGEERWADLLATVLRAAAARIA